jgi:tetratricopeptide (TPR) repeat protein
VAALFAWHPMHVESVAWAAERKDVLSTFFWLLTLLAYLRYARSVGGSGSSPAPRSGHAAFYFIAALIFCALGLMSKPMVVTLPCALLLLDFWPLNRIAFLRYEISKSEASGCQPVSLTRAVLEKVPFFALVAGGSVATYLAQAGGGAVSKIHLDERLLNAALAYARYVAKLFWPTDLSIVYPHHRHTPVGLALVAAVLLVLWTIACVAAWRKAPYLPMGWFWFLGTLVPTIGLIQVGSQSMADRYTYIPSIGLFIVVAWGATEFLSRRESGKIILPILGGAVLAGCLGATWCQIGLWRDGITLFRHAVAVTEDNYTAENVLGKSYERAGNDEAALACYTLSVKTEDRFPQSQFNLAMSLMTFHRTAEALEHLKAAADLDPRDPDVQYDLGIYFTQHNSWTNALNCFSNSVSVRPVFAPAQLCMGTALANLERPHDAATHFREALRLDPTQLQAKTNLDKLLTDHPELR